MDSFSNGPSTPQGPQWSDSRNASPSSTFSDSSSLGLRNAASRSVFRTANTPLMGTPVKKVIMRADPALITCFDPADKELYELWAPKQQ